MLMSIQKIIERLIVKTNTFAAAANRADMTGKTCIVTGANSGIGKATATHLAGLGARVVLICRNSKRGEKAREIIIKSTGNRAVDLLLADLSIQREVRRVAGEIDARYERIDVLINNAGLMTRSRRLSADGLEMQFAVNHLAPFLLTHLLLDKIKASAPARIITLASTAHSRGYIDFDDLQGELSYNGWQAYANSKLANVMFTYELARRLDGSGITVNCVHPGVIHTGLMRNVSKIISGLWFLLQGFFKKADEGAETPVYLASSPEVTGISGKYFRHCKPCGTSEESNNKEIQQRLWETSKALTGIQGSSYRRQKS